MCNNILQYAHLYAWGRENNVKVISMRFSYKYRYFELCRRPEHNRLTYLFAKLLLKTRLIRHLWPEPTDDVTPEEIGHLKNDMFIAVSGWSFRHIGLFLKYEDEIRKMFAIQKRFRTPVDRYLAACEPSDIRLGVHIRRGDYARFMGGIHFFDDDTYIRYIREFLSLFPDKRISVFICTNDKNLRVEDYREALASDRIHLFRGTEIEDLYLLSQCDYLIGPRSSFSLVASFYRRIPLYHLQGKGARLTLSGFRYFEDFLADI